MKRIYFPIFVFYKNIFDYELRQDLKKKWFQSWFAKKA